jgi:hypothetical protein
VTGLFGFIACLVSSLMVSSLTIYFYSSYSKDARLLKTLAAQLAEKRTGSNDKVRVLNSFVYHNQGFAKNRSYYLLKSLGATPLQVLEKGGDCADKSRLLAAMLEQIGIKASLAMLYPCQECTPVHTVVLAETESGTIVADPVYDLMFPKEAGGYYDVREMIGNPEIQLNRLRILRAVRGPTDKINFYQDSIYHYGFITTVNWFRYSWLAELSSALKKLGLDPRLIHRPALLENPKLLFANLAGATAALFAILAIFSRRITN